MPRFSHRFAFNGCRIASIFALTLLCLVTIPATLSAFAPRKQQKETLEDEWQVIYIGDQRVGYAHVTVRPITENGRSLIQTRNETHLTMKRFGQEIKMATSLVTRETESGDLQNFSFQMKNPPAGSTKTTGRVKGDKLVLKTTTAGREQGQTISWDPKAKSPAYQDRLMKEQPLEPGQTRSFKTFLPEFNKFTKVKVKAEKYQPVSLLNGKKKRLLEVEVTQSVLPTVPMTVYLDDEGNALKTETNMLGTKMVTYTVPKEKALKEIAGGELDVALDSLIKVAPIENAHSRKKIVYRIKIPGEDPSKYVSSTPTQKIRKNDSQTIELTVVKPSAPQNSQIQSPGPEYVAASGFLQSEDPRVVKHARAAANEETNAWQTALQMEKYVQEKLVDKNFSTAMASAAEVAQNLEGDCTEHAVLLAAMLRAREIPSRVAVGLVYIPGRASFGGHMWTEAHIAGRWIPLDGTRGRQGISPAYITMGHSSLKDDGPAPVTAFVPLIHALGSMEIEVVNVE